MSRLISSFGPAGLVCALALVGCGSELDPGSFVERPRVIGAELSVVGAPERPIPRRGESVVVRWIVARPESNPSASFTYFMAACEAEPSPAGGAFCAEESFAFAERTTPSEEAPTLELPCPEDLVEGRQLFVFGVLCSEGAPDLEALGDTELLDDDMVCTEGRGQIISQTLRIDRDSENTSPTWPEGSILREGTPWQDSVCGDGGPAWSLSADPERDFFEIQIVGLPAELRESYEVTTVDSPPRVVEARESLLISHLTTVGEIERQFSRIDDDESPDPILEWTLDLTEDELPPEGRTVRFYIALRDQRGGAAFREHSVCVVP